MKNEIPQIILSSFSVEIDHIFSNKNLANLHFICSFFKRSESDKIISIALLFNFYQYK